MIDIIIITLIVKLSLPQWRLVTIVCFTDHFGNLVKTMDIFSSTIF